MLRGLLRRCPVPVAYLGGLGIVSVVYAHALSVGPGRRPRILATAGWAVLAPFLFDGIEDLEIAAVGHLVSMLVGAMLPALFGWRPRDAISLSV